MVALVVDTKLFTGLLHHGLQQIKMLMIHTREQMMFNLHVEAIGQVEP